jgi:membrane-associated protein
MPLSLLEPETLIRTFGYVGLFSIIFVESGLFFGLIFPGDSLLFSAGLLASTGLLNIWILVPLAIVAAILGDSVGYAVGSFIGPRLFVREESFFFSSRHVKRTEAFFKKYGPKAILFARIVPIVRSFMPMFAGIGKMEYKTFLTYNIVGGLLWGGGFPLLGYYLGSTFPIVREYAVIVVGFIIFLSFVPIFVEVWRDRRARR